MKPNDIILKRLSELKAVTSEIEKGKFEGPKGPYMVEYAPIEPFQQWKISCINILLNGFGADSVHYKHFDTVMKDNNEMVIFSKLRGILNAAIEDYANGYVFKVRELISAQINDDILEQATELLTADYKDAACIVARVALENMLKELCNKHQIATGKLDKMNADLAKVGAYNVGTQKQITAWADRGNNAAHGNWTAYNKADVDEMIKGVSRFMAEKM